MNDNRILTSRRRFLIAGAAATAAVASGGYFLSRSNLVQLATGGRGAREGVKHKVIFVVVADGLATTVAWAGYKPPPRRTVAEIQEDGALPLWHPWDAEFGKSAFDKFEFGKSGWDSGDFVLGTVSAELEKYRGRSLYLRGVRGESTTDGHAGYKHILRDNRDSGKSIDQIMGPLMQGSSRSGALFAGDIRHNKEFKVSWAGRDDSAEMEVNPMALFETYYPGVVRRGGRDVGGSGVLDPAMEDLKELKSTLTGPEMQKLEYHLEAAVAVKDQLENGGGPIAECDPEAGKPEMQNEWLSDARYRADVLDCHSKVIASTLACGMTRVATFQVGASSEETQIYDENGKGIANAHQAAHHAVHTQVDWSGARSWYIKRVRKLLDELDKYSDPDMPDDSLLDHTLVVVTSELSDGLPEHRWDMPMLLIGGEKSFGTLTGDGKTGRAYNIRWQSETPEENQVHKYQVRTSRIWHTIAAAAGLESGFDKPEASGSVPTDLVRGIFSGVGEPIARTW